MNENTGYIIMDNAEGGLNISRNTARTLILCALAAACLYSLCFTGIRIYPKLSLFVFTCAAFGLLSFILFKLKFIKNKRAFRWAAPLFIVSLLNAVFELSFFTYVNVLIVHLMFAAFVYSAVSGGANDLTDIGGWLNLLKISFPNIKFPFLICKRGLMESAAQTERKPPGTALKVLIGAVIAYPVLFIITVALMSADAVFAHVINNSFRFIIEADLNIIGHTIVIITATAYFTAYVYNAREVKPSALRLPTTIPDTVIGFTFLFLINALFAFFCVIQTFFLFTGGFMKLPGGIVYSAYAREGFFQLLFVTVINFGVIIIFLKIFPGFIKSIQLKVMLITLCLFTGVLIISSVYRMSLYTFAYGHTWLRMNVYTFLAMEMVLIIITLRYLYKPGVNILKRYIYIGVVFYIAANIMSSAYIVGRLNVDRMYKGYGIDVYPLCASKETAGLLAEIYDTPEFMRATDEETRKYVYDRLLEHKSGGLGPWQNISVISAAGRYARG